jgi:hypothetical protein
MDLPDELPPAPTAPTPPLPLPLPDGIKSGYPETSSSPSGGGNAATPRPTNTHRRTGLDVEHVVQTV